MATDRKGWQPASSVAPGEILEEALEDRGMTQAELARRMDRPIKTINEIVKAKAGITAETALQLELVLDIPASFWLNLERLYAEGLARVRERVRLDAEVEWISGFPLSALRKQGVLPP